jgi:hypothetical protein
MKRRNFFKALAGAVGAGPALVKAAAAPEPIPPVTVSGTQIKSATVGKRPLQQISVATYSVGDGGVWSKIHSQALDDVQQDADQKFLATVFSIVANGPGL